MARALIARGRPQDLEDFTDGEIKAVGTVEVLGAFGVVVPAALKVAPILTPIAACGLALIMVFAAATLMRRGEPSHVPLNVVMFALARVRRDRALRPYSLWVVARRAARKPCRVRHRQAGESAPSRALRASR